MYGVTAGHANIIMGKSIDETIPTNISGQFGVLLNCYVCVGMMSSYFLGALLPTEESEFADDEMWRVIYAMPIAIAVIQILLFLTAFREEPVAYCVSLGKEDEAKKLMRRVYKEQANFDDLI